MLVLLQFLRFLHFGIIAEHPRFVPSRKVIPLSRYSHEENVNISCERCRGLRIIIYTTIKIQIIGKEYVENKDKELNRETMCVCVCAECMI